MLARQNGSGKTECTLGEHGHKQNIGLRLLFLPLAPAASLLPKPPGGSEIAMEQGDNRQALEDVSAVALLLCHQETFRSPQRLPSGQVSAAGGNDLVAIFLQGEEGGQVRLAAAAGWALGVLGLANGAAQRHQASSR